MPPSEPVRFAYVGAGFVAQSIHIPNFAARPNCQFVALAEARKELGDAVARRHERASSLAAWSRITWS